MKKILFSLVMPFVVFTALLADTVSQEEADMIVLESLSQETQSYNVYSKEGVQKEMVITSSVGELLELNYFCWVYFIRYMDTDRGHYLIVKESNGKLLEVDAKSGAEPEDLAAWRDVNYNPELCNLENPLTDLPWLKAIVDGYISVIQQGNHVNTVIYQCTYGEGQTGFIVDQGNLAYLCNCKGDTLCILGGYMGETCPQFKIGNKIIIWKAVNGIFCGFDNNPLEELSWLKKIVEEFTAYPVKRHFKIYECTYIEEGYEKIGFIVNPICVNCSDDDAEMLYGCTGIKLCTMGGIFGTCEFNIANKKLIWEINN